MTSTAFLCDLDPLTMFKPLTQQLSHPTEKLPSYADFLLKKNLYCLATVKGFLVDLAELFSTNVFQRSFVKLLKNIPKCSVITGC